ncbi:MAG: RnfH family protein [Janthinobacterium sp.]
MAEACIEVQVCHAALPEQAFLRSLSVPVGTTLEQALALSGLLQAVPGIDLGVNMVGIYGKKKPLDTVLREHDRVEVYRPLQADPKEARRRRAGSKPAKA